MNIIAHIMGMLALFWLALWFFNTLNEPVLGVVVIGGGLIFFITIFQGVSADIEGLRDRFNKED